jgi:hypothetical protein
MNASQRKELASLISNIDAQSQVLSGIEIETTFDSAGDEIAVLTDEQRAKIANALVNVKEELMGVSGDLENLAGEEQEKFDNMPENLQQGDRGQAIEAAAQALEEAYEVTDGVVQELEDLTIDAGTVENLDDLVSTLDEVVYNINEAMG